MDRKYEYNVDSITIISKVLFSFEPKDDWDKAKRLRDNKGMKE